jgi:hypothetical protein
MAFLDAPVQYHLSFRLVVLCRYLLQRGILTKIVPVWWSVVGIIWSSYNCFSWSRKRCISNWSDAMIDEKSDKFVLGICWMELNLVDDWLVLAVRQHIPQDLCVKIGNTNTFG